MKLTVSMITMNEEGAIAKVVGDIRRVVPDAEIFVVDSSRDRTAEIAAELGCRVVKQFPPQGYGPAMDRAVRDAAGDVVITLDCDDTYPVEAIPTLMALMDGGFDLVNTTRTDRRPEAMPFANFIANRVFALGARILHGLKTTDVHSGMRAYRKSMIEQVRWDPHGPALPVDMYVIPFRMGFRVTEVPIKYRERIGQTTLQRWRSTVWTFRRLWRARRVKKGTGHRAQGTGAVPRPPSPVPSVAILAGGLGTRLGALAEGLPKPMIEIGGRPYLERVIDSFARCGLRDIVLLTGHHAEVIEKHFGHGARFGVRIAYSREAEPLGTGGAVRQARALLGERFVLTYGDVLRRFDYDRFVREHREPCLAIYPSIGNVEIDGNRVVRFDKRAQLPYIDAGFCVMPAEVIEWLPERGSFEEIVFPRLAAEGRLTYEIVDLDFCDIGTPEELERTRRKLA